MAERVGFEPTVGYKPTPIFKTGAINQLDHLSKCLTLTIYILSYNFSDCNSFYSIFALLYPHCAKNSLLV